MKRIGLIGGLSWESTATYYAEINRAVRDALGGLHSAEIVMHSFDFAQIQSLQNADGWPVAAQHLSAAGLALQQAGAECLLICSNLMHRVAPAVEAACSVPLLHIADELGQALQAGGAKNPLLLATKTVMEESFYSDRLRARFGIEVCVPDAAARAEIDRIIFAELVRGEFNPASRETYLDILRDGRAQGADCVVFACTEIGLLLSPEQCGCPVYDTAQLHAQAAVDFALGRTARQGVRA